MATPRRSSIEKKLLHRRNALDPDRLQIRVVPYSPPRLSADGPALSCQASYANESPSPSGQDRTPGGEGDHDVLSESNMQAESYFPQDMRGMKDIAASHGGDQCTNKSVIPPAASAVSPSCRRPKRIITVNSDKTFSLIPQTYSSSLETDSYESHHGTSTGPSSTADQTYSGTLDEDENIFGSTNLAQHSWPPVSGCFPSASSAQQSVRSSSPWSSEFVGGIREVPSSKGHVRRNRSLAEVSLGTSAPQSKSVAVYSSSWKDDGQANAFLTRERSKSSSSSSTLSRRPNYTALSSESPYNKKSRPFSRAADLSDDISISPIRPNFERIGGSSSSEHSLDGSPSESMKSHQNYMLHREISTSSHDPASSSSALRAKYSREDLVPRLGQGRLHLFDQSSDSLPSALIESTAQSILGSTATAMSRRDGNSRQNRPRSRSHDLSSMHHQSSSTTSMVLSDGERDGQRPPSARGIQSGISDDSGAGRLGSVTHTHDWSSNDAGRDVGALIDRPLPTYSAAWSREANNSSLRLIRDHDENGDGLAELEVPHRRPSRTMLHSYLSSFPSARSLRSLDSSRSNSLSRSYIPAWARLYYGSGERRLPSAQHSSDSLFSEFTASGHRAVVKPRAFSEEDHGLVADPIPRQRLQSSTSGKPNPVWRSEADISPDISFAQLSVVRRIRKRTSSIWSPHLYCDKRARMYSLWRPPKTVLPPSEQSKHYRQIQIQSALFVIGFVFPLAWMAASFVSLSPPDKAEVKEKNDSTSHLDLEQGTFRHQASDDSDLNGFNRAKWWRNLNRYMSIVGLFVVGAATALTVTGTQQQLKA